MADSSAAPPTEAQVQEDLMRLDAYRNQLNALLQQHQLLRSSRGDHERARETLEGLDRIEIGSEVMIPLGADAYVRGTAAREAPVLLGIGSGVAVEMVRPKVIEVLHERLSRIDQATQEIEGQMRAVEDRIEILSQRLDAITRGEPRPGEAEPGDVGRD